MGWCLDFGPRFGIGCDHAMQPGVRACECPACGSRCTGQFSGCAAVWERGLATPTTACGDESSLPPIIAQPLTPAGVDADEHWSAIAFAELDFDKPTPAAMQPPSELRRMVEEATEIPVVAPERHRRRSTRPPRARLSRRAPLEALRSVARLTPSKPFGDAPDLLHRWAVPAISLACIALSVILVLSHDPKGQTRLLSAPAGQTNAVGTVTTKASSPPPTISNPVSAPEIPDAAARPAPAAPSQKPVTSRPASGPSARQPTSAPAAAPATPPSTPIGPDAPTPLAPQVSSSNNSPQPVTSPSPTSPPPTSPPPTNPPPATHYSCPPNLGPAALARCQAALGRQP